MMLIVSPSALKMQTEVRMESGIDARFRPHGSSAIDRDQRTRPEKGSIAWSAVAPPEVDLAWMAFMHFFFESMLGKHGMSGLPELLRPADMAKTYASLSGYEPRDLPWYLTYNGLRYAIVMFRITRRV